MSQNVEEFWDERMAGAFGAQEQIKAQNALEAVRTQYTTLMEQMNELTSTYPTLSESVKRLQKEADLLASLR